MNNNYVSPERKSDAFNCPYCGAYSHMARYSGVSFISDESHAYRGALGTNISATVCSHCNNAIVWHGDNMIIPDNSTAPMPDEDMPESVKELYEEARGIVNKSPRGAAALLRLALDKLCDEIDEECKQPKFNGKIDKKIAILVKNGLSENLQQILDFVRITGNDAVHELGIINVHENPDIATALFGLLNYIVEQTITRKKERAKLYNLIPQSRQDNIKKRNEAIKSKAK